MPESKEQKMGISKLSGFWTTGFHQESCYWRGKDLKRGKVLNGMSTGYQSRMDLETTDSKKGSRIWMW